METSALFKEADAGSDQERDAPCSLTKSAASGSYKTISRKGSIARGNSPVLADSEEEDRASSMDSREAYRRRKARTRAERANGLPTKKSHRHKSRQDDENDEHGNLSFENGLDSDFSITPSDEVELDPMDSDGTLSDDEETGLTKTERNKKKRKRGIARDIDVRIGGRLPSSNSGQKSADKTLLRTISINALLVVSWYIFSLSISIVSHV